MTEWLQDLGKWQKKNETFCYFYTMRDLIETVSTANELIKKISPLEAVYLAKTAYCVTSSEKGETVFVIACLNAEGHFFRPIAFLRAKIRTRNLKMACRLVVMNEKSASVTTG